MSGTSAPIDYPTFVADFPEFSNAATFPPTQVTFWLAQAYGSLDACRFGTQLPLAISLYTAHNLVLSAREERNGAIGQIPGEIQGPVASKTVGPLSKSYSGATNLPGAGIYNATTYGQRFYAMMRAYAAGPKYVPGLRRRFSPMSFR